MTVKVSGVNSVAGIRQLHEIGVDYVGMAFNERSQHYFVPQLMNEIADLKGQEIAKVGMFVDADKDTILHAIEDFDLTSVQLSGKETPEFCHDLMGRVNVIKCFRLRPGKSIDETLKPYHDACNYFLFDTSFTDKTGTRFSFDWKALEDALIDKLFFLSGAIGPDDAKKIGSVYHPFFYGVDINTRFETQPGRKDVELIKKFIKEIKFEANDPVNAGTS